MKYYKLSMDMNRENDIVCHFENVFGIQQNELTLGKAFQGWDGRFEFIYDSAEGDIATDYLANDKGWFVVSEKLKTILEELNTEIQFLPVKIIEKQSRAKLNYYIANITKLVDALCLENSEYFTTEIPSIGTIYTVSKYAIFASKTQNADVFKLSNRQEMPVFVSEKFKEKIEERDISGICLNEIRVS